MMSCCSALSSSCASIVSDSGVLDRRGFTSFQISTTGQEALPAPERAQFEADLARVNSDLRDIRFLPFLTLGVTLRF